MNLFQCIKTEVDSDIHSTLRQEALQSQETEGEELFPYSNTKLVLDNLI